MLNSQLLMNNRQHSSPIWSWAMNNDSFKAKNPSNRGQDYVRSSLQIYRNESILYSHSHPTRMREIDLLSERTLINHYEQFEEHMHSLL